MNDLEMTRKLAEKVMGWTAVKPEWFWYGTKAKRYLHWIGDPDAVNTNESWQPLVRIADAWDVRDKLAETGSLCIVNLRTGKTRCDFISFLSSPKPTCTAAVEEASAARAICLCALKAAGEEV